MKILVIHNKYKIPGGEDKVFLNEIDLLKKNGHDVDSIVFTNTDIKTVFSKIKAGFFSLHNPMSSKIIRKKTDEFKPDIIHVHNFFPLISPSVFYKKAHGNIPVVMTLHNYRLICANAMLLRGNEICEICIKKRFPLSGIRYKCYRNSLSQTLNLTLVTSLNRFLGTWKHRIDRYICLSEFQKNMFLRSSLNLSEEDITVKPNFVFDEGFDLKKPRSSFVFVGRLGVEKGVKTMIDAFSNTNLKIKIIGEGPLHEYVKNVCEKHNNMEFLGSRPHEFVIDQMKTAKGLVFPSINYEGFPMVIAESFSCGTPVITSDIGSQAEIVKDCENGMHFKLNDSEDLRRKVKKLNEYKDTEMYKNARKTYERLYNDKENYKLLIGIYKKLV